MLRYSSLWMALVALSTTAQPTLDQHVFPTAGTVYGYHDVAYRAASKPGIAQKWDYSTLPTGTIVPYQWTTTSIAPGAGAFPDNALVQQVPGEPTAYYLQGDTALLWLGTYTDSALVRFDPPIAVLDLPCGMNTHWTDTGLAAVTGSGRIDIRLTTLHAQADAWGTLVMPYGTVENVLRVRYELSVTSRKDPRVVHMREVRHAWYCDRTPMPLLVVVERSGWPPPERFMRWLDGSWQDDPGSLFRPIVLRAFPDPCVDIAYVDLPAARADRTLLQLIDGNGQVQKQWLAEFTGPQTRRMTLPMNDVPVGHYTLTWTGTSGTLGNARLEKQ
ncbi:MAG: hypothetical protein IPL52_14920 [Flavobacteriales bacterium]|nr:hypothetical protein [Flavobacteriales bacterium]